MAKERTSANESAYAEKHRILQALEQLATPENWQQFKQVRRAYKKFRSRGGDGGDRYDRRALLQDCVENGLIQEDEHAFIQKGWDTSVDAILAGMEKALRAVKKGDTLNCWIVYGAARAEDRCVYRRRRKIVDVILITRRRPPKGGPYKGKRRGDPGFVDRLRRHQSEIAAMLGRGERP